MKKILLKTIGIILCIIGIGAGILSNLCNNLCKKIDTKILTAEQLKYLENSVQD
jgi:hypothetical protein